MHNRNLYITYFNYLFITSYICKILWFIYVTNFRHSLFNKFLIYNIYTLLEIEK